MKKLIATVILGDAVLSPQTALHMLAAIALARHGPATADQLRLAGVLPQRPAALVPVRIQERNRFGDFLQHRTPPSPTALEPCSIRASAV